MGTVYLNNGSSTGTTSGAAGLPPSVCTSLGITKEDSTVYLKWYDPEDTIVNEQVLCTWAKTIIVRKKGSYPENESDGTVVLISTVRNAYSLNTFEDELPDLDNEYYYRAFPVSVNGVVCLDPQNKFGEKIYEFIINPKDSNPATCIEYAGENKNYKSAYMDCTLGEFNYGSWENAFFMKLFKPCMLYNDKATDNENNSLNGQVMEYLNPDDYSLTVDGTASSVANTSVNANAMVEIGQVWIKEELDSSGKIHIYIAPYQVDENYDCYTHINKDGKTYRDVIYRAMFDGCNVSNVIRSISGQAICKNVAGNTQISYAQANGDGWNVDEYNLRRMINYLLLLIGKSTDTQTVFGTGRYSGGSANSNNQLNTGQLNDKGMFWGDNANGAVKVFHIENWWGNIWKITNGIIQSGNKLYYKMCEGLGDGSTVEEYQQTTVTGYIDSGVTMSGTSSGYISSMTLVPKLGLVPTVVSGSSSTYFPDGAWWSSSVVGFAHFGCQPEHGLLVGAFAFNVYHAVSYSSWAFGVSLSYKKAS